MTRTSLSWSLLTAVSCAGAALLTLASCSSAHKDASAARSDAGARDANLSDAGVRDGTIPTLEASADDALAADTGNVSDATSRDTSTNDGDAADTGPPQPTSDASVAEAGLVADAAKSDDGATLLVPTPAAAAGFGTLVFEDDFTTADTIATTQYATSGFKWYWSYGDQNEQPWSVSTTTTAATLSNGNVGGGENASPKGGILTLTGPNAPSDGLITVPGWSLNSSSAILPAEGNGCWSHAYFEAYLQFQINGNASTAQSNGWPAFWSWSIQGLRGYGFGSSGLAAANYTEIDFMESYGTIFGNTPGTWTATMHQWPANVSSDGDVEHTDSNWHTYGCLWTSTGAGTGQVTFYFDGVQADKTVPTGTGQTQFSLDGMYQFLILGTGRNWDLNVDWVRVWQ